MRLTQNPARIQFGIPVLGYIMKIQIKFLQATS